MTKRESLSSVDNWYDSPLLTDTSQHFFVTDFFRPKNVLDLPLKPHLRALQPSHVLFLQGPRLGSIQKSIPDDSLYNSLLRAKAEGFCQQFFSFSKRPLCSGYSWWSKIFHTGSVLCNKAAKIVKGRFLKKDREFITRPFTEFITLVFLTLILIPYPFAVSCILSIISCRPLTELAKVAWSSVKCTFLTKWPPLKIVCWAALISQAVRVLYRANRCINVFYRSYSFAMSWYKRWCPETKSYSYFYLVHKHYKFEKRSKHIRKYENIAEWRKLLKLKKKKSMSMLWKRVDLYRWTELKA